MTPGERLRALHAALVDGFDLAGLDELATLYLGRPLEQIAGAGCDLDGAALSLVRWARRSGKVTDLVQAMVKTNPGNAQVLALALAGWTDERGAAQEPENMTGRTLSPAGENGVQHAIGTLESQVDTLQDQVRELRQGQRVMTWALVVSIAMNGFSLLAIAVHMGAF